MDFEYFKMKNEMGQLHVLDFVLIVLIENP